MTKEQFANLKPGDVIQHRASGQGFIIHMKNMAGEHPIYTIVRVSTAMHPDEWIQMGRHEPIRNPDET